VRHTESSRKKAGPFAFFFSDLMFMLLKTLQVHKAVVYGSVYVLWELSGFRLLFLIRTRRKFSRFPASASEHDLLRRYLQAEMTAITPAAMAAASVVLSLSKTAWRSGRTLSKFTQHTESVDIAFHDLTGEVKLLGNECDLIYAELEEALSSGEKVSPQPEDNSNRMIWTSITTLAEETSQTIEELELLVNTISREEIYPTSQTQLQRKLIDRKRQITGFRTKICRHTDDLHMSLLSINM
jgi:hypothetical protein